ncbi:MAG TPA: ATP-dependent Clp protease ATP-binding subunit ClpC [Clostridiales bacterium]|mgnify:CR=1 FL=1|nr:ATP-dependent Clp protease ATP-binding subunit ClpC [Clostridiales bacterium]
MFYNINTTEDVNKVLNFASESAKIYNNGEVATEHIVYGILCLNSGYANKLLNECGVSKEDFENILYESKDDDDTVASNADLTPRSKQVLVRSQNLANEIGNACVCPEHILFSILMLSDCVAVNILDQVFHVNLIDLKNKILAFLKQQAQREKQKEQAKQTASVEKVKQQPKAKKQEEKTENKEIDSINKNLPEELQELGIDLTEKARLGRIDPIIGRDKETLRVIEILCRKTKNNPCLVGEAGVGKSAVVEGLALKIVAGDVPPELKDKIVFSLNISGLMSGTKFRGALEQKLRSAISAITNAGNIILFIDEIHTLAQMSNEKGEVSPADILKPYLARGELNTIGATTNDEYRKFLEKDKALERRFQPVTINPPSKDDTLLILKGIRDSYEAYHGVKISDGALKSAIDLADRYITNRNFPDKAIDLIDEACSSAKLFNSGEPQDIISLKNKVVELQKKKKYAVQREEYEDAIILREKIFELKAEIERLSNFYGISQIKKIIGEEDIAKVVSLWTNIPVTKLNETEKQKLLNLENILHSRVIGQDEAITNVAKAVRRSRVGIKSGKRPIGSFLFLGPTGVGKTELSKAIAEALFDDENNLIRLDMSEFMEANSVSKLIGSPPGYVGYEEGGQLTERVRRNPYSVVLLDEIEKANNDVLNILLQLLDDGRLTDSQGRLVNFQNTIIIMTSNVGYADLKELLTDDMSKSSREEQISSYLTNYFRPELINRIDNISFFHSLNQQDLAKIAKIMLMSLLERLKKRNIDLKLTQSALNYLITKGYNAEFGARPLRRLVEQEIEDVIAEDILREKLKDNYSIVIDEQNGELTFEYIAKQ